jgi:hypothetical protein
MSSLALLLLANQSGRITPSFLKEEYCRDDDGFVSEVMAVLASGDDDTGTYQHGVLQLCCCGVGMDHFQHA